MKTLQEQIESFDLSTALLEAGPIKTEDDSVNLLEISSEDEEILRGIETGVIKPDHPGVLWLQECGLAEIRGPSVVLTQFAKDWLFAEP